jgi:hypothetical protein
MERNLFPPGGTASYMFTIEATSGDATKRGIAAGDYLGRIVLSWRKAMGAYCVRIIYIHLVYIVLKLIMRTIMDPLLPELVVMGSLAGPIYNPVESHNFLLRIVPVDQ